MHIGMHMDAEARALTQALGLSPEETTRLHTKLVAVGGLVGLRQAGATALFAPDDPLTSRLEAVLQIAERLVSVPPSRSRIQSPADVVAYFGTELALSPVEELWVLMLDGRARPLGASKAGQGILTECIAHPREVFAPAMRARAAGIILVHNHPSGDPEPSDADRRTTARMFAAGQLLGIPLFDHVVVAREGFRSVGWKM